MVREGFGDDGRNEVEAAWLGCLVDDGTLVLHLTRKEMKQKEQWIVMGLVAILETGGVAAGEWKIASAAEWEEHLTSAEGAVVRDGMVAPAEKSAKIVTKVIPFESKRSAGRLTVRQSVLWENWIPVDNIGPVNLRDAPVLLAKGPGDYWMFGRYGRPARQKKGEGGFEPEAATLEGFDIPLQTTPFPNQFDAPGGLKRNRGGYHAWQSRDMKNWVHHGPITEGFSRWMTTAEFVDGKAYFYYDFPNDQDPHLYLDDNLFDGEPGTNKGIAFRDPTHGSDCGVIRDLEGDFHVIAEDWTPINARTHAWDSPLATHGVSPTGLDFKVVGAPVDHRTKPTGKTGTYKHPHWVKEDPARFKTNVAEYEIHEPEQNAYGDWAPIAIGGQYYLFCDYDPADGHGMSTGRFTAPTIDGPFTWCGHVGSGHPDPDVVFAEGRFYLATQQKRDFVSPGPWVESVEARVGVDTDRDGQVDQWSDWAEVKESYDFLAGFAKQVKRTPAELDVSALPAGYGFQVELKLDDTTENQSKPMIEELTLSFQ